MLMRSKRSLLAILAVIAALIVLAGCSTVGTQFDEEALHYDGGMGQAHTFRDCVDPSKHETNGPGDSYFKYPISQRSFDFTGDSDSESAPITITAQGTNASGAAAVELPGVLTFTLNGDCATLRQFHEKLGNKYHSWTGGTDFQEADADKNGVPDGWENLLKFVMGNSIKNTAQDVGNGYNWQQLYSDATVRLQLQNKIQAALPAQIKRLDGSADKDYFLGLQLTLNQPTLKDPNLSNAIADQQAAVAKANSQKAQADAQAAAANAQVSVARAQASQVYQQIKVLGIDGYLKKYAIDKGISPWPNPVVAGSGRTP